MKGQEICNPLAHRLKQTSCRLHGSDPASHLSFLSHSWQVAAVDLQNSIPAEILLQGDIAGWKNVEDIQSFISAL